MPGPRDNAARAVLGIRDAAVRLGVSIPTLRRWDRSGKLRAARHPHTGARVYRREALDAVAAQADVFQATPEPDLIGRHAELERLARTIREGARCVSVVGAGGIGKTTLANALAARLRAEGWHTVFCDLSEGGAEQVLGRLTDALGVQPPGAMDEDRRLELVGRRLARLGPAVVTLDNAEHVVRAVRSLLGALVTKAPRVAFVVTTRERLGLRHEVVLPLEPLALPAERERDPARILGCESVALLVRAAGRGRGAFDVRSHARALGLIARRLDGIPLALELGGARLATFSPPELLGLLDEQLDVLGGPRGHRPSRHATLRAAIRWSYDLLDGLEQRLLDRLAVFRGGFGAAAVHAVAGADLRQGDVARALESLHDKSLVFAAPGERREPRFDLYASIRELAAERLASRPDEEASTRARHTAFFARLAESALSAPPTDVAVDALVEERDNILAAFSRCREPERGLLLAIAADYASGATMSIPDRVALLDHALARASSRVSARLLARARATRGRLLLERNDFRASLRDLDRALVLARRGGDDDLAEYARGLVAVAHVQYAPRKKALVALARAEKGIRGGGGGPGRLLTWAHLASVQHEVESLAAAERSYGRALALARAGGHDILAARIRARLGRVYCDDGRMQEAEEALCPALEALHAAGDRFEAWAQAHWALLSWRRWRLDDAREAYERATELFAARGAVAFEAVHHAMLASVLAALGRGVDALAQIERARLDNETVRDKGISAAIVLAEGHRALLEARRARGEGRVTHGEAVAGAAIRTTRSVWERDKDVRALAERLRSTIGASELPAKPTLVVASDGAWLSAPGARRGELPLGSPLRLLLGALVEARRVTPGRALSRDEVTSAAWPSERILARAAAQRVYAAVSELRALGLGPHLERLADGYRIAPSLPLRIEGDQP